MTNVIVVLVFISLLLNLYFRLKVMRLLKGSQIHKKMDFSFKQLMSKPSREQLIAEHPQHKQIIYDLHKYMFRSFLCGAIIVVLILITLALTFF